MTGNKTLNKKFLSLPGVKNAIETFMEKTGFDEEETIVIFDEFLNVFKNSLAEINKSIEEKNYEELYKKAHSLKGTFVNLYMPECADLSIELEQNAKAENIERCRDILNKIQKIITD